MASDGVEIFGFILQYGAAVIACGAAFYTATKSNEIARKASNAAEKASDAAKEANLVSEKANSISEKNLSASVDLEIIKFREKWIQNLREEMSRTVSLNVNKDDLDVSKQIEFDRHVTKMLLLMNPNDNDYDALLDALVTSVEPDDETGDYGENYMSYIEVCQKVLKREWDRLKLDIERYKEEENAKNK